MHKIETRMSTMTFTFMKSSMLIYHWPISPNNRNWLTNKQTETPQNKLNTTKQTETPQNKLKHHKTNWNTT